MKYSLLVALMTITTGTWASEPVPFADDALEAAVKQKLGIENPTATDMRSLTSLAAHGGIVDLTGLEHAVNLESLDLHGNRISDLSRLSALTNLQVLVLYDNGISDLTPLAGLTKLKRLSLYSNSISDIRPLGELTDLEFLDLHRNRITDITPVGGMLKLVHLNLHINRISDISPVASLTELEFADWHNNRITDISAIDDLTRLVHLHLADNTISDISALGGLENLAYLHLGNNRISDVTPLSRLDNLTDLLIYGNPAVDAPPPLRQPLPPADRLPKWTGRWNVEFANGVHRVHDLRADATATVQAPVHNWSSTGHIEVTANQATITYHDDRVERWTPVGDRMVVEHWFPASKIPVTPPILGIGERAK